VAPGERMASTDSVRANAWRRHQQGDQLAAEQLYRQLLQLDATPADAVNLGALLREQGRLSEGIQHYQVWLQRFPEVVELRLNALNCAIAAGALPEARQWLQEGLDRHPHQLALRQGEARLLQAEGKAPQALQLLSTLCQEYPTEASLWKDLGVSQHLQGLGKEALAAFERAAALAPDDSRTAANRLTVLEELGRLEEAETLINAFPEPLRRSIPVRGAIAHLWMAQQQMVEAADEFADLCRLEPNQPLHWLNRTACLRSLKHNMAALAVAKQGLALHPQHPDLGHALGQCLADTGKPQQALTMLSGRLNKPETLSEQQLFNLQFLGAGHQLIEPTQLARLAQHWEEQRRKDGVGPLWQDRIRRSTQGRPLRVGYLSADFCNHPVGRFLLAVLEHHNPEAVEVVGLSCGPHADELQARLRQCCRHWLDLRFASDLEAARMLSDLELDVLVELGGYTAGSRLGILCHRPAPVQLSYLGYFAPTYLDCIDGWIGDSELFGGLCTHDRQAQQLLIVEGGYMAYQDDALPTPERQTTSRALRFGSFNHARKLSHEAIALFCSVMEAVPAAELVLKSISFVETAEQQRVRDRFVAAGLNPDRLVLLPWVEGRHCHLNCYGEIDVGLDPLPYGGATTTCEALAMGVPVVSLAGQGMVGRLSASVLRHAGCGQWIAADPREYVAIASALAAAGLRHDSERQALKQQLFSSALGNGRRLAAELERLYRSTTMELKASSS
jgi:protein O-GlcNAc transferase